MNNDYFFTQHPVFHYAEFINWKRSQGVMASHAVKKAVQYALQKGRITRIRRELYAVVPLD